MARQSFKTPIHPLGLDSTVPDNRSGQASKLYWKAQSNPGFLIPPRVTGRIEPALIGQRPDAIKAAGFLDVERMNEFPG